MRRAILAAGLLLTAGTADADNEMPVLPDAPPVTGSDGFDWTALVRLFAGWNSNVQLYADVDAADAPNLDAFLGGATLDLAFRTPLGQGFTLGGSLRADVLGYLDQMPASAIPTWGTESDYNFAALQPTLSLQYQTMVPGGTAVTLNGAYSFRV